jgi:hypothetical protein
MNKKIVFVFFLIGLLIIVGCKQVKNGYISGGSGSSSSSPSSSSSSSSESSSSSSSSGSGGSSSSQSQISNTAPPAQLQKIETSAVTIIDNINKSNWTEVNTQIAALKTNANEVSPQLSSSQMPNNKISGMTDTITKLEQDIKLKNSYTAKMEANQITSYICDIYDSFAVKTPVEVNRLNYYSRAINLDIENSDWTSSKLIYDNSKTAWGKLKTMLTNTYKTDIDKTESILLALGTAIDAKNATSTKSQTSLMFVQITKMQTDFTKLSSSSSSNS